MAVLSDTDRAALWAEFMRDQSASRTPMGLTKADLRAAVDAADAWADSNAASFNTALPQPARNALTRSIFPPQCRVPGQQLPPTHPVQPPPGAGL
jgi:hypothetical protein